MVSILPATQDDTRDAIVQCEQMLLTLKEHFNTFAPINALLPTEIIADILLILVDQYVWTWVEWIDDEVSIEDEDDDDDDDDMDEDDDDDED